MKDFIGISRCIVKHWIYQDAEYFKTWFEMIYRARYSKEPEKKLIEGHLVTINRGEFLFGRKSWSERLGVSEQKLRTLIKKLTKDEMIEVVEKYNKFTHYKIVNYEKFNQQSNHQPDQSQQGLENNLNHQNNQHLTSSQPAPNQQPTTQEYSSKTDEKKKVYRKIQHLVLTEEEFIRLNKEYNKEDIDDILDQMENYKKLNNYTSANLTARNWLKKKGVKKKKEDKPKHKPWNEDFVPPGGE